MEASGLPLAASVVLTVWRRVEWVECKPDLAADLVLGLFTLFLPNETANVAMPDISAPKGSARARARAEHTEPILPSS